MDFATFFKVQEKRKKEKQKKEERKTLVFKYCLTGNIADTLIVVCVSTY